MNDIFDWGNDRFVLGKLPDSGNSTKKKKTARELFEEAILGEPEEQEFKEFKKDLDQEENSDKDNEDDATDTDENQDKEEV